MRNRPAIISLLVSAMAIVACLFPSLALAGEWQDIGLIAASSNGQMAQSGLRVQNVSASATNAINSLKTRQYYKPGGSCPSGKNVGWLKYNPGSTYCENECYAFAAGVCNELFGSNPGGIMDTGYTCSRLNGFSCVEAYKWPSFETVKAMMQKGYPGDFIQFCSGNDWGGAQHSAILEAVDANGVRIYQHGNSGHVMSTYYNWNNFYYQYLGMNTKNYRGYSGLGLYHANNYSEKFPEVEPKGEMYPGNTVTTVPANTECVIKSSANKSYVWDVQGASGYDGCNLQLFTRKDIPCQKFTFEKNEDGTYHILNWSGNYGVYVGLTDWTYANQANVVMRYTCDWTINCWYVEATPDGYYSFRNKHSGKYLEVSGGYVADGTSLKQHAGNGTAAQKFAIEFQAYPGNSPASSDELTGTFLIESAGAENYVVDVQGGTGKDGTNLQLWTRNNTLAQRFSFVPNDDGTYGISNWSWSGGAFVGLAVDSYTNGANIVTRYYVPTWSVNRWYVEKTPDGYYSFRNKFSSLYLDVAGGAFANGTNIWQYAGNGTSAQKFKLIKHEDNGIADDLPEGDPGFIIRNAQNSDFVLTVDSNSSGNHCNATMRSYVASHFQRFVFWLNKDDGTYTISNWGDSGLALGLGDWSKEQGVNVEAHDLVRDHAINRWYVETTADGYYSFRNKYSGKYLDATGCIEGYNVLQWGTNDGELQKWILEPCDFYYTSLKNAEIALSENSFSYTGETIEPAVTVNLGGSVVDPENYTVQYSDNVNAGEASISVVGKKSALYDGSATATFTISGAPISNVSVSGVNASYTFTGEPIEPRPQVSLGGKALVEGSDYAVSYYGSEGIGDAGVTIIGLGNYSGEKYVEFAIEPIRTAKPAIASFTYDGLVHTGVSEAIGFTLSGTTSEASAGNYSASAQLDFGYAWDDGGFDDLELEWRIDPATVTDVALSESSYVCNGDVQRPSVSSVQAGGLVLGESDYDVSYSNENSKDAGTYAVTVTGKGNFCGSRSATYVIEPGGSADGDRAAAEAAIAKVSAIGAVTLDSGDAIEAARQAYDSLTAEQKALVPSTVLEALINAETSYRGMVDEEAAAGKRAAAKVGGRLAAEVERAITSAPSDEGPAGSSFSVLQARSPKQTKSSVALAWTRVPGAQGYTVYANRCGKGNRYVKLADVGGAGLSVASVAGKKVAKGTYYKFIVAAWRTVDGHKVVTAVSKAIHVATKGGKVGNYKKVKLNKKSAKLKKGKKLKLKATPVAASKKLKVKRHRKVAFESSDPKVATVTAKGAVKAVGKGACYVYAYSQSGTFARCKVTVK